MITTVTFNPAIDKRYYVEGISIGKVQRVDEVENTAGGKGLNVSRVASILGEEVVATGFIGGTNGQFIADELQKSGIRSKFQQIEGQTRCCLAIIDTYGNQTEFLEPGPEIKQKDYEEWLKVYEELLDNSSVVIASGSLPRGLKVNAYAEIIEMANKRGIKFLLDTSGEPLLQGINAKPYFIKPNMDEIKLITGKDINTEKDIIKAVLCLNEKGIELVTVSMGKKGSISGYKGQLIKAVLPEIKAVNSVGSGDSFTAGIAVSYNKGMNIIDSIRFASACGAANAMESRTGFVRVENVKRIFSETKAVKLIEGTPW